MVHTKSSLFHIYFLHFLQTLLLRDSYPRNTTNIDMLYEKYLVYILIFDSFVAVIIKKNYIKD